MPAVAFAKDEKGNATDTGVKEVTDGINVIKDLVLGCVGGVGVIFRQNIGCQFHHVIPCVPGSFKKVFTAKEVS